MLTQDYLRERFIYNPITGDFSWLVSPRYGIEIGDVAGSCSGDGYCRIRIMKKSYLSHRLAFLYMEGEMPLNLVDHANGNCSDNRWCNLRHATLSENIRNSKIRKDNTSGYKGVGWNDTVNMWVAQIGFEGRLRYIGKYDSKIEAAKAYNNASKKLHGEFSNINKLDGLNENI